MDKSITKLNSLQAFASCDGKRDKLHIAYAEIDLGRPRNYYKLYEALIVPRLLD